MAKPTSTAANHHHHHHRHSPFNNSVQSLRRSLSAIQKEGRIRNNTNSPTSPIDINGYGGNHIEYPPPPPFRSSNNRRKASSQHNDSRSSSRRGSMETVDPPAVIHIPSPEPPRAHHKMNKTTVKQRSSYRHGNMVNNAQHMIVNLTARNTMTQVQRRRSTDDGQRQYLPPPPRQQPDTVPRQQHQQQQQQQQYHRGFRSEYSLGDHAKSSTHIIMPPPNTPPSQHAFLARCVESLQKHDFAFVKRSNGQYSYAILAYRMTTDDISKNKRECPEYDSTKGEGMVFVIDEIGSTKMIRKKYWCDYVRLVAPRLTTREDIQQSIDKCKITYQSMLVREEEEEEDDDDEQVLCQEIPFVCQEVQFQDHRYHYSHAQEDDIDEYQVVQDDDNNNDMQPWAVGRSSLPPTMISFVATNTHDHEECSLISSISEKARRV